MAFESIEKLKYHRTNIPLEKAYLHSDKTTYSTGENIWFSAYLVESQFHLPSKLSNILYVELTNENAQVIASRNIRIENGSGHGDFSIPDSLQSGNYALSAYTNYMRNFEQAHFFEKRISIINSNSSTSLEPTKVKNRLNITFFPEGGYLVDSLASYVAFKATDQSGKSVSISGRILDGNKEISTFQSFKFGLGKFTVIPYANSDLKAEVAWKNKKYTFELPKSIPRGYSMKAINDGNKTIIKVVSNFTGDFKKAYVLAHTRETKAFILKPQKGADYIYAAIPNQNIPSGTCHFTFFDSNNQPQCERLMFVNNPKDELDLEALTSKSSYSPREKIEMGLQLFNQNKKRESGRVSISILNNQLIPADSNKISIQNYLLLSSDLKGHIESPGYFFKNENRETRRVMDLLMLTHGWRRFVWKDVLNETLPDLKFSSEKDFSIEGEIKKFYNRNKALKGNVTLSSFDLGIINEEVATTDEGFFSFQGLKFTDTTSFILQANKPDKKVMKKNYRNDPVYIELKKSLPLETSNASTRSSIATFITNNISSSEQKKYLKQYAKIQKIDSAFNLDNKTIVLDEVQIDAKSQQKDPFYRADHLYRNPDHRLVMDDMAGSGVGSYTRILEALQGRVSGLRLVGTGEQQKAVLTRSGGVEALYLLDGIPVDLLTINLVPIANVAYVDVVKRASPIFGSRSGGGIVAVFTRTNNPQFTRKPEEIESWGIISFDHPGYYAAREFYVPNYETVNPEKHFKPDFRSTLYWNPNLKISNQDTTSLEFFASDEKATYRVEIEGLSNDGKTIMKSFYFKVE